ncbi:MAG TPA: hypothetical protein VMW58_10380 [Anaerolineae bacterium]|nr:hypothetical protein [Anaerolineae bacterium]
MGLERSLAVLVSLGLLILGLCVGCGEPPPLDMSLLTGGPCGPPCWQGLTPGVSTEEEVNDFLRSSELVDQSSIFRGDMTRGRGEVVGTTIQWWSTANMSNVPRQFGNRSVIKDGMLQYMTIWVDSEVTLQDLLETYGAPAKFTAWLEGVESPYVRVTLFYPRHGFEATLIIRQGEVELTPDGEIVSVWYFRSASQIEDYLRLCRDIGYPCAVEDTLQDWHGYGPLDLVP